MATTKKKVAIKTAPIERSAPVKTIDKGFYRKPAKTEKFTREIMTPSGAMKTKTYEKKTYPNGVVKSNVVSVVKH